MSLHFIAEIDHRSDFMSVVYTDLTIILHIYW